MTYAEIWKTLSVIDCSEHVETKGNGSYSLSYLSWAWAWGVLMDNYPDAQYDFIDENRLENGTVEVTCRVSIGEANRMMWLPVMDHKNKSIVNPTTRDISDARMRCLVKCLAMFGLGFYIYAGEDVPQKPGLDKDTQAEFDSLVQGKNALGLLDLFHELGSDLVTELYNSAPQGKKTALKKQVNELETKAHEVLDTYAREITEMSASGDPAALQYADDLTPYQKQLVWGRMDDHTKHLITNMRAELEKAA